ncbi:hypothetical protein EP331_02015 [bacterium]|nr:MAG: hypothetical protein EP331_02015 [bacterium]
MNSFTRILGTLVVLLLLTVTLHAQPPNLLLPPDAAPIDGGLSVLAAAGATLVYKKLKSNKKSH